MSSMHVKDSDVVACAVHVLVGQHAGVNVYVTDVHNEAQGLWDMAPFMESHSDTSYPMHTHWWRSVRNPLSYCTNMSGVIIIIMFSSCMVLFHIAAQSALILCMQPVRRKYEQLKVVTAKVYQGGEFVDQDGMVNEIDRFTVVKE